MRKHFLILMLLTLLPFTAWGTLIKVKPYNVSKYYGVSDAKVTLVYETEVTPALSADEEKVLKAGLFITRNGLNSGEAPADYTYTLEFDREALEALTTDEMTALGFDGTARTNFLTNYTVAVNGSATLSIKKMPLSRAAITVAAISDQEYTGSAITPALTVTNTENGEILEEGSDYEVSWTGNVDGPIATGTLTALGDNYSGTKTGFSFNVRQSIANAQITFTGVDNLVYTGAEQKPATITVKVGNTTLTETTHYTVSYANSNVDTDPAKPTNAGTVTVTITGVGTGGYSGTATKTYEIAPKAVAAADIELGTITNPTYTGSPVKPTYASVTAGGLLATIDDYEITDASTNATAANGATATLTLKRNFTGSKPITYTINQKEVTPTVTLAQEAGSAADTYVYSKSNITPAVTVKDGDVTIDPTNYTLEYDNDDDATNDPELQNKGAKKVRVLAKAVADGGNYSFTAAVSKEYTVAARPLTVTVADLTVGIGADYKPVATIGNLPGGATKEMTVAGGADTELGGAISFQYDRVTPTPAAANVVPAEAGTYTIRPIVAAFTNDNYIYNTADITNGTLTITKSQVIVKVVNKSKTYGDALSGNWEVQHVSGIATDEVNTFITALNTELAGKQANFTYDAATMVNAGKYSINYKDGTNPEGLIPNDSYTISVQSGTLTVDRRNMANATTVTTVLPVTIDYTASRAYDGTAFRPTVTITSDVNVDADPGNDVIPASEYTVTYAENPVKAGTYDITITANEGGNYYINRKISTSGGGRWADNIIKTYTITKLPLNVTASAGTYVYGSNVKNFNYTIDRTGLIAADAEKTEAELGFNGDVKVKIVAALTVGEHAAGLRPYFANKSTGAEITASATNYAINLIDGPLTIEKGRIVAKVKDLTVEYGDPIADGTFHLEAVSGMEEAEVNNFDDIVTYNHNLAAFDYDATEMKAVNTDGYTINYKFDDNKPTATNYTINVVTSGTLTVIKRNITVKSLDQTVNLTAVPAQAFDPVPSITPAANPTVAITAGNLVDGDGIDAIIDELTSEASLEENSVINIVLKESAKYNVTVDEVNAGHLTLNNGSTITLGDGVDDETEIATWAASEYQVNVLMDFSKRVDRKFNSTDAEGITWTAEKWNTLVLPFDITVADLSKALGYAIVNVINPEATKIDGSNIEFYGKLTMKGGNGKTDVLAANKPIMVKTAEPVTGVVNFGSRKIVGATDLSVDAGQGAKFVGTYATKTVTKDDNEKIWFMTGDYTAWDYIGKTSEASWDIVPFEAYIDMNTLSGVRSMTFVLEDIDGSTTAIKSVNADNFSTKLNGWYTLDGVKLQVAPTQKGVYIKDGKKVVLK